MKIKITNRSWQLPDDMIVEPFLTVVEQDHMCRVVLSDAWGVETEALQSILHIALSSKFQMLVIPKVVFSTQSGEYTYYEVQVSYVMMHGNMYLTLEASNSQMSVGIRE